REFMASLRFDLFQDEVYVFTPRGDIKELPEGATPVDFAYSIHTEVGDHCAGAKVNGRLVPLNTALKNGDRVEIITDKNRKPSRDWLKFVKTAKAITRVKHYVRTEERARSIVLAKELLEREGRKVGINVAKGMKEGHFLRLAVEFNYGSVDELLSQVGYSRITPKKVIRRLYTMLHGERREDEQQEREAEQRVRERAAAEPARTKGEGIKISGVDNMLIRFASCCNPLPGEPIIGYITRGRGVTIHTTSCANVKKFEPERLLSVTWEGQEDKPYPARVRIKCRNVKGVLAHICGVLSEENVNIDSGAIHSDVDGTSTIEFTVEVRGLGQLQTALARVQVLDEVSEAVRIS
ncbi:MAG: TGS domain-containing protein, partial [Desulfovibrionaceae bacterium]|nr:TGS domain-containing protein [Desulfovibrionaceae bacterium]